MAATVFAGAAWAGESTPGRPLTLVVMDPLAAQLACDCVEGYAQRKYEALGTYLERTLNREVKVVFSEALARALKGDTQKRAALIIGKDSVVRSDAAHCKLSVTPLAALTGRDGKTTQWGLFVVPASDPARSVADLKGYRILFGPADCDEKSAAPMKTLQKFGVPLPEKTETAPACSDAATKLLEFGEDVRAAAVISSYAKPLLEGCGTIKKGDLRVIGQSDPVPFITAFVTDGVAGDDREQLRKALLAVGEDVRLLLALETGAGFVKLPASDKEKAAAKKKS